MEEAMVNKKRASTISYNANTFSHSKTQVIKHLKANHAKNIYAPKGRFAALIGVGDYYMVWQSAYQAALKRFGRKKRRYDEASETVPDLEDWTKHFKQEGHEGGWKAVPVASLEHGESDRVKCIESWPVKTAAVMRNRTALSSHGDLPLAPWKPENEMPNEEQNSRPSLWRSTSYIWMDLLGAAPTYNDPRVAGDSKRAKWSDQKEELLLLVARGYLGLAAKQRALESVAFLNYETHSGDPAVVAAKEVGVKAARAQSKVCKTPQPLYVPQFLAFMEALISRDATGLYSESFCV